MRVYPRPRGGAEFDDLKTAVIYGLSPPTRGSRCPTLIEMGRPRSIPAHAGEPRSSRPTRYSTRVYPRPRGGARSALRREGSGYGLSPPTRGSHSDP